MLQRLLLLLTLASLACSSDRPTGMAAGPGIASIRIMPDSIFLPKYDSVRLSAAVLDSSGAPLGVVPEWASSLPLVADVDMDGLVSSFGGGHSVITARAGGAEASVHVWVDTRPSFDVAILRGTLRDSRGAPVTRTALRAHVFFGPCGMGREILMNKFSPQGNGTFGRTLSIPSFIRSFTSCITLEAIPDPALGLQHTSLTSLRLRFVDTLSGEKIDTLDVDLVLPDLDTTR